MRVLFTFMVCMIPAVVLAGQLSWMEALAIKPAERPVELKDSKLSAQQLNVRGMDYYKKKQLEAAALVFYEAIERDRYHVLANYNLACTLALLRRKHGACSGFHPGDAFTYLKAAIDMDKRRRSRANQDKDFSDKEIQNSLAYRLLLLNALGKPMVMKKALAGTSYQTGSFNYVRTLKLAPDGTASWKGANPDPNAKGMGPPPAIAFSNKGRWSMEGDRLRLQNLGDICGWYMDYYSGLKKLSSPKQKLNPETAQNYDFGGFPREECGH